MDRAHYEEMVGNLEGLLQNHRIQGQDLYVFGHCNASEVLIDLFAEKGYPVKAILDNNSAKHGTSYKGVPVVAPDVILKEAQASVLVCIVARASAAMERQLRRMGFAGSVEKLVEYNSYAEYSLSKTTIMKKQERLKKGLLRLERERERYPGCYRIYCPFSALGDVYYMMSYLPYFLKKKSVSNYVVFTIGKACRDVVELFEGGRAEVLSQREMDESIQAVLYTRDPNAYIPHQDRPYVVNLAKSLYVKKIPLELIYKCGVFGLDQACPPRRPQNLKKYGLLERIVPGKAVILAPYAKSVTNISEHCWKQIIAYYKEKGYQLFTNTARGEIALPGTWELKVGLSELRSVVEWAGTFIGLRSGLCDVIQDAACKKIALYPDCCYSDTKWKMEEIYHLDGWENIVVPE